MPSYSSKTIGSERRLREAVALYRIRTQATQTTVNRLVDEAQEFERIIERTTGEPVKGKSVLEVGPGHFLVQSSYFARNNRVTAIDTDVIPIGIDPAAYISMFVHNGLQRTVKTVLRKAMGIDARHRRCLKERLQVSSLPAVQMERGDVCQTKFPGGSFDVVIGRSVMHHVPNPSVALGEIARVLRPNGAAVANFHLYTSHNGSLDARVMSGDYDESLLWAHLRPATGESFEGNRFLNKMRLDQWRTVLFDAWPGCTIETELSSRPGIEDSARAMISSGEIAGYSLEELTTHTVLVYWRKPAGNESAN